MSTSKKNIQTILYKEYRNPYFLEFVVYLENICEKRNLKNHKHNINILSKASQNYLDLPTTYKIGYILHKTYVVPKKLDGVAPLIVDPLLLKLHQ